MQAGDITLAVTASSLVLGIIISLLITRSITVPLDHMAKKTAEIGSGIYGPALDLRSPPEIGALAQAFNFMSAKLRNVDKMKSDFYSLMSHELRTPLTSIKEGTNLFLEGHGGPVTEKQKWLLTIVAEESNRLIELVNSLMDLSKLEAGMLAYNFTKAELPPWSRRPRVRSCRWPRQRRSGSGRISMLCRRSPLTRSGSCRCSGTLSATR